MKVIKWIAIVIGILLLTAIMTIAATIAVAHIFNGTQQTSSGQGDGLFLNGTWQIQEKTYNDEMIIINFYDDAFQRIIEVRVADAELTQLTDNLNDIRDFYRDFDGSHVEIHNQQDNGGDYIILQTTLTGTFGLTDNEIWLTSDSGIATVLPFSWDADGIYINNDRFMQVD